MVGNCQSEAIPRPVQVGYRRNSGRAGRAIGTAESDPNRPPGWVSDIGMPTLALAETEIIVGQSRNAPTCKAPRMRFANCPLNAHGVGAEPRQPSAQQFTKTVRIRRRGCSVQRATE
jgi:hypothetical protein